jgi:hypothetical protein
MKFSSERWYVENARGATQVFTRYPADAQSDVQSTKPYHDYLHPQLFMMISIHLYHVVWY